MEVICSRMYGCIAYINSMYSFNAEYIYTTEGCLNIIFINNISFLLRT